MMNFLWTLATKPRICKLGRSIVRNNGNIRVQQRTYKFTPEAEPLEKAVAKSSTWTRVKIVVGLAESKKYKNEAERTRKEAKVRIGQGFGGRARYVKDHEIFGGKSVEIKSVYDVGALGHETIHVLQDLKGSDSGDMVLNELPALKVQLSMAKKTMDSKDENLIKYVSDADKILVERYRQAQEQKKGWEVFVEPLIAYGRQYYNRDEKKAREAAEAIAEKWGETDPIVMVDAFAAPTDDSGRND